MGNHILVIDGHNFMHRARAGFDKGEYSIVFTFFRNLRALVEQHDPTKVLFVLEGHPQHRYDAMPEYKANRVTEPGTEKHEQMKDFHAQKRIIISLLKHMPVIQVRHPHFECDDAIYNLILSGSPETQFTVVSNDSDFIQLLQKFENVQIWNPMLKTYVEAPDSYDYISHKSLVGDGSDNIAGFAGIGPKRAEALLTVDGALETWLQEDPARAEKFNLNYDLIHFADWTDEQFAHMTVSIPEPSWPALAAKFEEMKFQSLLKDKPWAKFKSTFDKLEYQ